MSWIFFLLSVLVDIIETKKFCKFEISTPFRFRVAVIRNIGGIYIRNMPVSASCCSRSDIDLSTLSSIFIDVDVDVGGSAQKVSREMKDPLKGPYL